ncbi:MAG TPA: AMP-binding protein [Gemmatimonadaceae bacterium]|nr:AMP-binding protein [Gemmatimonadaceae bacterium]
MPLRTFAVGARGWYLRSWRYGPETERLIAEAAERESWNSAQWQSFLEERLARVLHRAATRVPYYRAEWEKRRRAGDRRSPEYLEHWPILAKETVRADPRAFLADDMDERKMYHERTSGTTGTPLDLWLTRETVRAWFALYERRTRGWYGVSRHDAWVMMGGQPVIPPSRTRPPFWVWNAPMKQLYVSSSHVSARNAAALIGAIQSRRATHLVTYASTAAALATEAAKLGLHVDGLRVVITNAEPVFSWQREIIREVFGCPVQETYGMAELVASAGECSEGSLHLWPEMGKVEILDDNDDAPVPVGEAGRLVCTGLLNTDMPLVRFAVGDRGARATRESCGCGRMLPILSHIEGRTNDLIIARDGRRVYWLNPILYGLPIHQAQIIQETLERLRIRYVPAPGFTAAAEREIKHRLHQRLGDVDVVFESLESIPREANGKFKAVRCDLSADERERAGLDATAAR